MDKTTRQFEDKFGGVWTKVKFYKEMPDSFDYLLTQPNQYFLPLLSWRFLLRL